MKVKINLNNLKYRYDIYQIFNLFYPYDAIEFGEEESTFEVIVENHCIILKTAGKNLEKTFEEEVTKQHLKREIFKFLKSLTHKELPWGTLVGIRPSKIALDMVKAGYSNDDIIKYFRDNYLASEKKAQLCIDVAAREESFVNHDKNLVSVYVGMAFCPTRCVYCSFASNPIGGNKKLVEPYVECLKQEISAIAEYIKDKNLKVQCVYFGGGTPTSVDEKTFHGVMKEIYDDIISQFNPEEFTVECGRPDSITEEKLKTMKDFKVNRISINPQTMNDNTLKSIGRNHDSKEVIEKFNLARSLGFDNINMDIIVGLPGEGLREINHTLDIIKKLSPDNLTVHGMSIKRASKLHEEIVLKNTVKIAEQEELNKMYEATTIAAKELGMKPYYMYRQKNMVGNMENIGYSIEGKESIYNIQIIEEKQTILAAGADAVTKVVFLDENRLERFADVKDVREYVKRLPEMVEKKIELLNTLYS
ncbi:MULTISPECIES: coproporphyrinogen III oxidase [Clostridium]|uniref:Coproporphyrinogen III oxidase n=1 Tax=Clostridium cadaveris TaxID=1529 RepID=A0A1I2MPN2_9CLOT|nr:coproporphyrinogen III oxidase [Clostridium cadaveris]MDU4951047.1 coproporphyrinogen III oxidase [Clostridium sp.]MDM8311648.1 coproporphyrinogen III oxidase [Clostridium cadaveris]MDY4948293.1 coproporphyrinogen III oxidase [Clostridium cadaveris]NME65058.1 coproporphyrinogen III oxidase [Clostridium cadaveris]PWL52984.1 MAG: coproporphyrinogen III oxidase [Clostridium cadaveris]